jgi:single-stranded-DNA-specific exonuclease
VGTNHLIATFKQNGGDKVFDSIGFNLGDFIEFIDKDRDLLDIVYTLEIITKDGKQFPQLRLKDIRIHENNRN